eukprot:5249434-Amphidinium_carterae.1
MQEQQSVGICWMSVFVKSIGYMTANSRGPIPPSLMADAVLLSHNLLQGTLPQHLLDAKDPLEKWVAANTSVSRWTKLTLICAFKIPNPSVWRHIISVSPPTGNTPQYVMQHPGRSSLEALDQKHIRDGGRRLEL